MLISFWISTSSVLMYISPLSRSNQKSPFFASIRPVLIKSAFIVPAWIKLALRMPVVMTDALMEPSASIAIV